MPCHELPHCLRLRRSCIEEELPHLPLHLQFPRVLFPLVSVPPFEVTTLILFTCGNIRELPKLLGATPVISFITEMGERTEEQRG